MLESTSVNIFGKLTGLLIGFFLFGPVGLLAGLALGHLLDITIEKQNTGPYGREGKDLLPLLFSLFGRVAGFGKSFSQGQALFLQGVVIPRLGLSPWDHNLAVRVFRESLEEAFSNPDSEILSDVTLIAKELYENFFLDRRTLLWIHATCRQLSALGTVRLGLVEILDTISREFFVFEETGSAGFERRETGGEQDGYKSEWSTFRPAAEAGPEAYRALGLESQATVEEIKKAYRTLVREHHPDRLQHLKENDPKRKQSTEKFLNIQHAYERIRKDRHF